jgi:hypothetical protein
MLGASKKRGLELGGVCNTGAAVAYTHTQNKKAVAYTHTHTK